MTGDRGQSWFSIKGLSRSQNSGATQMVVTGFNRFAADEIDRAIEQFRELLVHGDEIKETPLVVRFPGHQEVDITIGAKVVAQDRTEQFELGNLPAIAQFPELLAIDREIRTQGDRPLGEVGVSWGHGAGQGGICCVVYQIVGAKNFSPLRQRM